MTLTWIDWLFVAVLTVTGLAGFLRGLVREALGLAAWILALLAARSLAPPVADLFAGMIDSADGRLVLAFVLVIFAVILLCGLVIRMLHAAVEWVGMGLLNRVAGTVFGMAKGTAILILVTLLLSLTPLVQLQAWQEATLRPTFERLQAWAVSHLEAWEGRLPEPADLEAFSLPGTAPAEDATTDADEATPP